VVAAQRRRPILPIVAQTCEGSLKGNHLFLLFLVLVLVVVVLVVVVVVLVVVVIYLSFD